MRDPPDIALLLALVKEGAEAGLAARVRAIAAREAASGDAPYAPIRAALVALYGAAPDRVLLRRLADDIRAGRFDERPERDRMASLLKSLAVAKLREDNPGFLWAGAG